MQKLPQEGTIVKHYKTGLYYIIRFYSKAGDKEDDTRYITYSPCEGNQQKLYTRTTEDFFQIVAEGVRRFQPLVLAPDEDANLK